MLINSGIFLKFRYVFYPKNIIIVGIFRQNFSGTFIQ